MLGAAALVFEDDVERWAQDFLAQLEGPCR